MQKQHFDVLIVGAGVIGCSIAYHAASAGLRTLLIERGEIASEASQVGAGMLAPLAETHDLATDLPETHPARIFQRLCLAALSCYEDLDGQLKAETGMDIGLVRLPTLRLALSEAEAETLQDEFERQKHLLPDVSWLDAKGVREIEPVCAAYDQICGGILSLQEMNVSGTQLAHAYVRGALLHGAWALTGCTVGRLLIEHERVIGVKTDRGLFYADHVVLSAGAWASRWHVPTETPPIFPLKGQALSLQPRPEMPLRHTLYHTPSGGYLVPKSDGSIYVGATSSSVGFDKLVTAEGVTTLLNHLALIAPALQQAIFKHNLIGLRPASADGLPLLGAAYSRPGLWLAGGHFRNGILLAPLTGKIMTSLFLHQPVPFELDLRPFDPDRFGGWDGTCVE